MFSFFLVVDLDSNQECVVEFDFLGKDSMRYENVVEVNKKVFKNLGFFMENKVKEDLLFDRLDTGILNTYLKKLMPGLTAKVFRTFNASTTLEAELQRLTAELPQLTNAEETEQQRVDKLHVSFHHPYSIFTG